MKTDAYISAFLNGRMISGHGSLTIRNLSESRLALYSYDEPIAVLIGADFDSRELYVIDHDYSPTTNKHVSRVRMIATWPNDAVYADVHKPAKVSDIDRDDIRRMAGEPECSAARLSVRPFDPSCRVRRQNLDGRQDRPMTRHGHHVARRMRYGARVRTMRARRSDATRSRTPTHAGSRACAAPRSQIRASSTDAQLGRGIPKCLTAIPISTSSHAQTAANEER